MHSKLTKKLFFFLSFYYTSQTEKTGCYDAQRFDKQFTFVTSFAMKKKKPLKRLRDYAFGKKKINIIYAYNAPKNYTRESFKYFL